MRSKFTSDPSPPAPATKRSRVFVVEPNSRYDLSTAEDYGDIVYISPRVLNPFHTGTTMMLITQRLEELNFNPERDYFVFAGYMLTVTIATAVIISKYHHANVLMYEARDAKYVDREFNPNRENHDSATLQSERPAIA